MYLFYVFFHVGCWVDWEFFLFRSWCPNVVGIEFGRNLEILLSVKKGQVERLFFLWNLGAWSLLGFPCFYVRSWGYYSLFSLVGSHSSVALLVLQLEVWFNLVKTSTVWWLVLCSLLIIFSLLCVPAQSVLWIWMWIRCLRVLQCTGGAPGCHWTYMLSLIAPIAHPFLFCIVYVRWFIFHMLAGPLLLLFFGSSCLDYSHTNSLRWPHYQLLDLNFELGDRGKYSF